jgi:hypothetical protein
MLNSLDGNMRMLMNPVPDRGIASLLPALDLPFEVLNSVPVRWDMDSPAS